MKMHQGTAVETPDVRQKRPRPFLKWAGGKTQLLEQFGPLLPAAWNRYFEPFVGGGALFFSLTPPKARLTDVNAELVDAYIAIRDEVAAVVEALRTHRYDKKHYYRVRGLDGSTLPLADRAARTIFLNKTSFNGLYRVNRRGGFNVPFGRHRNPLICDEENLLACAAALHGADIALADFADVLNHAGRGDFAYFDPPYAPLSDTSDFTAYIPGGFGMDEQARLATVVRQLDKSGTQVMLSNSDVPAIRDLYKEFRIRVVEASRRINSKADGRGKISEIVVTNY